MIDFREVANRSFEIEKSDEAISMKHPFLLPPPVRLNQAFDGEFEGSRTIGDPITRRKFLKRTGGATVAALVASCLLDNSLANTTMNQGSSSWALVCAQEPAEGDWGEAVRDVVGAHGGNVGFSLFLGGNRYLALATAVTNHTTPSWGSRCVRVGSAGRGPDNTWAKICVAGAFLPIVQSVAPATVTFLKPKHYVLLTVDPATGIITASDSGAGHTDPGTAGGSTAVAKSQISFIGNGTKRVTLDVEWSFEWSGFTTAEINIVKSWVKFGASANNSLIWKHNARFVFEAVERSDLNAKCAQYSAMRIDRVHSWTNEGGQPCAEVSPFGYYENPAHPLSTLLGVGKLTSMVTDIVNGAAQNSWEF